MFSEPVSGASQVRPPPQGMAAANSAANRPADADVLSLAKDVRKQGFAGPVPASPAGLGGNLDLYAGEDDAMGNGLLGVKKEDPLKGLLGHKADKGFAQDFNQGLSSFEPLGGGWEAGAPPPDFPYLRPLADDHLGKRFNSLS